jgi:hypothetical protein
MPLHVVAGFFESDLGKSASGVCGAKLIVAVYGFVTAAVWIMDISAQKGTEQSRK